MRVNRQAAQKKYANQSAHVSVNLFSDGEMQSRESLLTKPIEWSITDKGKQLSESISEQGSQQNLEIVYSQPLKQA